MSKPLTVETTLFILPIYDIEWDEDWTSMFNIELLGCSGILDPDLERNIGIVDTTGSSVKVCSLSRKFGDFFFVERSLVANVRDLHYLYQVYYQNQVHMTHVEDILSNRVFTNLCLTLLCREAVHITKIDRKTARRAEIRRRIDAVGRNVVASRKKIASLEEELKNEREKVVNLRILENDLELDLKS